MLDNTLVEYITAFGGGSITLYLLQTWNDNRKGRLIKKQKEERAIEISRIRSANILSRGRLWEVSAYRASVEATKLGAAKDILPVFPPSMDDPYPEIDPDDATPI